MKEFVNIGELNQRIELISFTETKSTTNTPIKTENEPVKRWAKVIDVTGSEDEDGKIRALSVRSYIITYSLSVLQNGTKMLIRDVDGDYNIHHAGMKGNKRYLVLKCSKNE